MQLSKMDGRWRVVLSLSLAFGSTLSAGADEALPPPPAAETMPAIEGSASAGAELPPPPASEAMPPMTPPAQTTAEAPAADSGAAVPSLDEVAPPAPSDALTDTPSDSMAPEAPPAIVQAPEPSRVSARSEFSNMSNEDKLKTNDLVLWLSLGPSYGSLTTKGNYIAPTGGTVGGVGYAANFGIMIGDAIQAQFDMTGTPLTDNSTVSNAMFGLGPRLGIFSVMALLGVEQGPKLSDTSGNPPNAGLFAYGVKAGLDFVINHSANSRVSYGIAPEAYYVTSQGSNGFSSMGASISLRIYGYDNAF